MENNIDFTFIASLLFVFLLSGFILGFLIGGSVVENGWKEYVESEEIRCEQKNQTIKDYYNPENLNLLINLSD